MVEGLSPEEIIEWLASNDVTNNPWIRQYGIVDFDDTGSPRSAAFTGSSCFNWKGHITGPNYAIQGNILLGAHILDSMENRFLNTRGTLAEKLMAALQGANMPGADTRCLNEGVSSLSSFIRVAKPSDTLGTYWCDLLVKSTPYGVEPIDSLQILFDQWMNWVGINTNSNDLVSVKIVPNPTKDYIVIDITGLLHEVVVISIYNSFGQQVFEKSHNNLNVDNLSFDLSGFPEGIYILRIESDTKRAVKKITLLK
jgi:uncharacterized Ntn-hydrolase superfamily protein